MTSIPHPDRLVCTGAIGQARRERAGAVVERIVFGALDVALALVVGAAIVGFVLLIAFPDVKLMELLP